MEERADQLWALTRHRFAAGDQCSAFDGNPRWALVTVNFSTTRWLKLMLLTLTDQSALARIGRVVIVDNDSRDGGALFARELAGQVARVTLVENRVFVSHARGMRTGLRALDDAEVRLPEPERCNLVLSIDTDVIFRNPETLRALARPFVEQGAAAAGELRKGLYPYPEAQASFLAVRRDVYSRKDISPWVNHGAPAYWLQRSIWKAGLTIAHFPSNAGGYILHRGRAGVRAATEYRPNSSYGSLENHDPHFMGVKDGAKIWTEVENRWAELLEPAAETRLLAYLRQKLA